MNRTLYRLMMAALVWVAFTMLAAQESNLGTDSQDYGDEVQLLVGVDFGQISFTFPGAELPYSRYGAAIFDFAALDALQQELGGGFLNVIQCVTDSSGKMEIHWVVKNLPLVPGSTLPGVSTMFDLGFAGLQQPVHSVSAEAFASKRPRTIPPKPVGPPPAPPPHRFPPNAPKWGPIKYTVLPKNFNAQGFNPNRMIPPGLPVGEDACKPILGGRDVEPKVLETEEIKGEMTNVEQGINQCCPGALANSLQYLKALGVDPGLKNIPGVGGNPKDSLEAQIDLDMQRTLLPKPLGVSSHQMICGKLNFLTRRKLDSLTLEHQGKFCKGVLKDCFPDGNITLMDCFPDRKGLTSAFKGAIPTVGFIEDKINLGADIEAALIWQATLRQVGGHCIRILGFAVEKGVPSIYFMQDAKQGEKGGVSANDLGLGWTCLKEVTIKGETFLTMPAFIDGRSSLITNLMSEEAGL